MKKDPPAGVTLPLVDTNAPYALLSLFNGQAMTKSDDVKSSEQNYVINSLFECKDEQIWLFDKQDDYYRIKLLKEDRYLRCVINEKYLITDILRKDDKTQYLWSVQAKELDYLIYKPEPIKIIAWELVCNSSFPTTSQFEPNQRIEKYNIDDKSFLQQHWYLVPQPNINMPRI